MLLNLVYIINLYLCTLGRFVYNFMFYCVVIWFQYQEILPSYKNLVKFFFLLMEQLEKHWCQLIFKGLLNSAGNPCGPGIFSIGNFVVFFKLLLQSYYLLQICLNCFSHLGLIVIKTIDRCIQKFTNLFQIFPILQSISLYLVIFNISLVFVIMPPYPSLIFIHFGLLFLLVSLSKGL